MLGLIVAAGLVVAADKDDANKKALEQLQGEWKLTSAIRDGKEAPAKEIENAVLTVKGDTFTMAKSAKGKIDATKKPAEIDITPKEGSSTKGIYKLEGDTLTFCFAKPGNARPKEFASKEGGETILMVFKKSKK
jgi:uncharacterized protein (TIGR03067 family)